jgi:hypothetical protein
MFIAREFMLHLADSTRAMIIALKRLEDYVDKEGEFDSNRVSYIVSDQSLLGMLDPIENSNVSRLPKEALTLASATKDLAATLRSMCLATADCYGSRKMAYSNQVRKMKEISNVAIRNALQNERAESTFQLTKLRDVYQSDKIAIEERLNRKIADHERNTARLEEELATLQQSETQLRAQTENIAELRALAVERATSELGAEFEKIKSEMNDQTERRVRAAQEEAAQKAEGMLEQSRQQMSSIHKGEEEVIQLLKKDKGKLESELADLRQQLMKALTQVSHEKERSAAVMREERSGFEKHLQELAAQNLASRTQMQEEFVVRLKEARDSAEGKYVDASKGATKAREQLLVSHAVELETLADKHRSEISRIRAEVEETRREELTKLRKAHNHELSRMMRENEMLQRLVAKAGGGALEGRSSRELTRESTSESLRHTRDDSYFDNMNDDDEGDPIMKAATDHATARHRRQRQTVQQKTSRDSREKSLDRQPWGSTRVVDTDFHPSPPPPLPTENKGYAYPKSSPPTASVAGDGSKSGVKATGQRTYSDSSGRYAASSRKASSNSSPSSDGTADDLFGESILANLSS